MTRKGFITKYLIFGCAMGALFLSGISASETVKVSYVETPGLSKWERDKIEKFGRVEFDIDNDGKLEEVFAGPWQTSGVYSVFVVVKKDGKVIAKEVFMPSKITAEDFELVKKENKLFLKGKKSEAVFEVQMSDSRITLSDNGKKIPRMEEKGWE